MNEIEIWNRGLEDEFSHWDNFFRVATTDRTSYYAEYLEKRLNWNLPLHKVPSSVIDPFVSEVKILDVGSGPLPFLGRVVEGKQITLTAVDYLADRYCDLYNKYQVVPSVFPVRLDAEHLIEFFPKNHFDLVYARNSLDHTFNPIACIAGMIAVSKRAVVLEHVANEGERENYTGLHQWNFYVEKGRFMIRRKNSSPIDVSNVFPSVRINSEITIEEEERTPNWLVVKITK